MTKTAFVEARALKAALDFSTVLDHYGIEISEGIPPQVKTLCPFHEDHKASCSINLDRGIYKCFACDTGGNVLDFIMLMEHDEVHKRHYPETAKVALSIMGISAEDLKAAPRKPRKAKIKPTETQKETKAPSPAKRNKRASEASEYASSEDYSLNQPTEPEALENKPLTFELSDLVTDHTFFDERGLSAEAVETFGLGKSSKGIMRGRIVIPIHDENGQLLAYAGRHCEDEPESDGPRYRLPKGFHKQLVLFNLHRAKELGSDHLVIVEGFWSVIRLHMAGIPCVATLGASLSAQQADLVSRSGFKQATLIFDGDEAGRKGAAAAIDFLSSKVFTRRIDLDDGIKPDTMSEDLIQTLTCAPALS